MTLLNTLFTLPSQPQRRRSPDLVYAVGERPPAVTLLILGAQHAMTAMVFIAYVLIASSAAGVDRTDTQALISMTLLGMAACTALQAWGGHLGSGLLLVHRPTAFLVVLATLAMQRHGPGIIASMSLTYGMVALLLAPLMRHLRRLFPPAVVGTVIFMGGVSLVAPSMHQALGTSADQWHVQGNSVVVASVTLAVIVGLSIWGRRLRVLALILAIAAGVLVAPWLGLLPATDALHDIPVFALPSQIPIVLAMDPILLLGTALVAVLTQLDTVGSVTVIDKMEDADWKRTNLNVVAGGIRASGLGNLVAGLLGGYPSASSSANIALAHATRSTARVIGLVTAGLLALVAFLPQITMALTLLPGPVLSAVGLYTAAFLIVTGMEMATSRALDARTIFAVGLSVTMGLAALQLPELVAQLPVAFQTLAGNGFVVTGILVVVLNRLLHVGTSQHATWTPTPGSRLQYTDITDFIQLQGAAWGVRRNVLQDAAAATLEAAEAINNSGRRLLQVRCHFDEFNLDVDLQHEGAPLQLPVRSTPIGPDWFDRADEQAIAAALEQISAQVLLGLVDRVRTEQQGTGAVLKLHLEH